MANRFKLPITGTVDTGQLASLIGRLADLDKKAGRAAVRKGLDDLTKKVLADARSLVPRRTGFLKKAIGRKVVSASGGRRVVGVVKPRGGDVWVSTPPNLVREYEQRVTKGGKTQFRVPRRDLRAAGRLVNPRRYAHLVEFGRVALVKKAKKVLAGGGWCTGRRSAGWR